MFVGTVFVIVVISLLTAPIPVEEIAGLTWATLRKQKKQREVEPQLNHAAEDSKQGFCFVLTLNL